MIRHLPPLHQAFLAITVPILCTLIGGLCAAQTGSESNTSLPDGPEPEFSAYELEFGRNSIIEHPSSPHTAPDDTQRENAVDIETLHRELRDAGFPFTFDNFGPDRYSDFNISRRLHPSTAFNALVMTQTDRSENNWNILEDHPGLLQAQTSQFTSGTLVLVERAGVITLQCIDGDVGTNACGEWGVETLVGEASSPIVKRFFQAMVRISGKHAKVLVGKTWHGELFVILLSSLTGTLSGEGYEGVSAAANNFGNEFHSRKEFFEWLDSLRSSLLECFDGLRGTRYCGRQLAGFTSMIGGNILMNKIGGMSGSTLSSLPVRLVTSAGFAYAGVLMFDSLSTLADWTAQHLADAHMKDYGHTSLKLEADTSTQEHQ